MAAISRVIEISTTFRDVGMAQARRAMNQTAAAADNLRKKVKDNDDSGKDWRKSVAKNAEQLEKFRSALGGLGDVFGDVTGGLDDMASLLEQGVSPMAVFAGSVLAASAALVALGSGIASTVREIDDMEEALRRRADPALNEAIGTVKELKVGVDELSTEWDAQWVLLTARLTPALKIVVQELDFLLPKLADSATAAAEMSLRLAGLGGAIDGLKIKTLAEDVSDYVTQQERLGQSMTDLDPMLGEITDEFGQFVQSMEIVDLALTDTSDATSDLSEAIVRTRNEEEKALETKRKLAEAQWKQVEALREQVRIESEQAGQRKQAVENGAMADLGSNNEEYEASLEERRTITQKYLEDTMANIMVHKQAEADLERKTQWEISQVRAEGAAQALTIAGQLFDSIAQLVNIGLQLEVDATEKGSRARRKAALKAFKTQKALAIVSATINTALAIVNAIATAPNIILGIAMMAVAAAAGIAQIAVIASQKPPDVAHTGKVLAPDEVMSSPSLMTRDNEVNAIITKDGTNAAINSAVNALNRGQQPGGGNTYLVVPDKTVHSLRQFAEPDPGYGQAMMGRM